MPSRQPKKDKVNSIAIKKEKAVTLCPLLPYVYDSCLLGYGRPGWVPVPIGFQNGDIIMQFQ